MHLGLPDSKGREQKLVSWLEKISSDCEAIYLVGDVFDYWYEYKQAVPRGAVRLLGKLALMADQGVKVHFFKGNHDMWMFDYLQKELGAYVHDDDLQINAYGKKIFMHHGDGLGPGDTMYKLIKRLLRSKICQGLFSLVHPSIALWLMRSVSKGSRNSHSEDEYSFKGKGERFVQYVEGVHNVIQADMYMYGHRHVPMWLTNKSRGYQIINLGDWMVNYSYARLDADGFTYDFVGNEAAQLHKMDIS